MGSKSMHLLGTILVLAVFPTSSVSENYSGIVHEMDSILVETVVVAEARDGIPEPVLWSDDGESLAFNFKGEWLKLIPRPPVRRNDRWAGGPIGEYYFPQDITPINGNELLAMKASTPLTGERQITTDSGTVFRVITDSDSERNELVITDENGTEIKSFDLGFNRCHSLSLSPAKNLIAYVCNGMGVLISKIDVPGVS